MYNTVFDSLYWSLGGIMLVAFVVAIAKSIAALRHSSLARSGPAGILAIGVGAMLTLVVGFSLNMLRSTTGDLLYQQAHFMLFYVAFGLILFGFDRVGMLGGHRSTTGHAARAIVWGTFGLATAAATFGLLRPDTYRLISGGDVRYVQEPLFFLPLFAVLAAGSVRLRSWVHPGRRRTAEAWLAALSALLMLGMLREATLIPSTDEPILDLLLAFGPFTLAALCLYRAASLARGPAHVVGEAVKAPS